MEKVLQLNGRCFKKLVHIGLIQSVRYRIIELKARNTSRDAFAKMLSDPKNRMEGRFEQLELEGCLIQVVPYPTLD